MATDYDAVTPHRMRQARKALADARAEYQLARNAALSAPRFRPGTRRRNLEREDLVAHAWSLRHWVDVAQKRVASYAARGIVKGANVSPAARASAFASGRWVKE
jgi:hypothetical protein